MGNSNPTKEDLAVSTGAASASSSLAKSPAHASGEAEADAGIRLRVSKSLLRFNTCGSVDDGKSTLIGRLLWDTKALFDDQLATLEADSKKVGTRQGEIDYALLLDGLSAEREQGITIDVAYRFFSTEHRKFIVADKPGHERHTRNFDRQWGVAARSSSFLPLRGVCRSRAPLAYPDRAALRSRATGDACRS